MPKPTPKPMPMAAPSETPKDAPSAVWSLTLALELKGSSGTQVSQVKESCQVLNQRCVPCVVSWRRSKVGKNINRTKFNKGTGHTFESEEPDGEADWSRMICGHVLISAVAWAIAFPIVHISPGQNTASRTMKTCRISFWKTGTLDDINQILKHTKAWICH